MSERLTDILRALLFSLARHDQPALVVSAAWMILKIEPADEQSFERVLFAASTVDDAIMFLDDIQEVCADGT